MVFGSAGAFFATSDSVARINTFLVFLVTRFGGGAIIVSFAFNSVTANVGIGGVSPVTRGARAEGLVIDGLAGGFLGAKCKFARIFTFVASGQGVQDAGQVVGAKGITETLVGLGTSCTWVSIGAWWAFADKGPGQVFANTAFRANLSSLAFIDVLATIGSADESFLALTITLVTSFTFATIILNVATRSTEFVNANFALQTILVSVTKFQAHVINTLFSTGTISV